MPRDERANSSPHSIVWSTTLSSRQRVLLHAQPILMMRHNWGVRDDEESGYDPLCLSMKLFDVVIDQSGFGNEVVRQTVANALSPMLTALDHASNISRDPRRYERVVDRLLDGLLNEANHGQAFQLEYCEFDEAGQPSRKTFTFKLLKEVHGYSGEIALQLSSEAINLFLNALDLDIESEQIANEAVVQYQLERGKYDKARASAENARGQSLRFEEKIQRIIDQTKRDIRQIKWRDEVHGILVDALEHVQQRLKIEDGIIRSATDKLDAMDEADDKRSLITSIVQLMKDCRFRHLNLNKVLMSARSEFLEQQARQCFVDVLVNEVINLRDDVLGRLLMLGSDQSLRVSEGSGHTLIGPAAPPLLMLSELVRWQLQPRRAYTAGEAPLEGVELNDFDCDRQRFDEDVLVNAAKVFAGLDREEPIRLSELLAKLEEDGCSVAVQDAVTLEVLENYDPEEEAGLLPYHIRFAEAAGLATERCQGDDLWIEPLENKS